MVVARTDRGGFKPIPKPLPQLPPDVVKHCPTPDKKPTFEQKDANHDGKLNADEFKEGQSVFEKLTDPDKFDRYDTNNDGYVSKNEDTFGRIGDAIKKSKMGLENLKPRTKDLDPGIVAKVQVDPDGPKPV